MGGIIPWWKQARGCSARPQSHYFPKGHVLPSPPLQPAHTLTFQVRYAELMPRAWRGARLGCARGRHVPLWGEMLCQLGGEGSVRGEKEAFAALSLLQQLLCQMYWSRASQLHWADGTQQPERSCWQSGAASTAKMRSVMGSKGPLASSKSVWHLPLPSASWVSSCWRLGYSATISAPWAPRKYVHFPRRSDYNGT